MRVYVWDLLRGRFEPSFVKKGLGTRLMAVQCSQFSPARARPPSLGRKERNGPFFSDGARLIARYMSTARSGVGGSEKNCSGEPTPGHGNHELGLSWLAKSPRNRISQVPRVSDS